jgi:hypothetical protein
MLPNFIFLFVLSQKKFIKTSAVLSNHGQSYISGKARFSIYPRQILHYNKGFVPGFPLDNAVHSRNAKWLQPTHLL